MTKIAVPTQVNKVEEHFGHCEKYTTFHISDSNRITEKDILIQVRAAVA